MAVCETLLQSVARRPAAARISAAADGGVDGRSAGPRMVLHALCRPPLAPAAALSWRSRRTQHKCPSKPFAAGRAALARRDALGPARRYHPNWDVMVRRGGPRFSV